MYSCQFISPPLFPVCPSFCLSRVVYVSLLGALVGWLALDTAKRGSRQLVSFFGLLLLIFFIVVFSKHPFRVKDTHTYTHHPHTHTHTYTHGHTHYLLMYCTCVLQWCWQTLVCGIVLQFVFGLLILRTTFGFVAMEWLGKNAEVHTHLDFWFQWMIPFLIALCASFSS